MAAAAGSSPTHHVSASAGPQALELGDDVMEIMPLGSGCEVGRSAVVVKFKGSTIMFDCGVHPGRSGLDALPFFDEIEPSEVDLLLVTHFHMDHCGAVPYFVQKTTFNGRIFMTHPTKAVCKLLLHDSVKIGNDEGRLWDETDLVAAMDKVELVNYHQVVSHKGIRFWCYNAGHVLGAAMFMIEIGGVRVLYTGDFSRQPDRHLLGAETPTEPPHVLIVESTYGVMEHEPRELRELRFTSAVHNIVKRGGRCLIPVFALGRSQELLLILDAYWRQHPELHRVPIYYASGIAKRCMRIYQTYINMMNDQVRDAHAAGRNPWEFSFVRNLPSSHQFDDALPMVVMASPGMLQQGLSRELFETWCSDRRNGLVMPGYSVAGTLANHLLTEPKEIQTSSGDWVPVNLSITYISFSAHSDFAQTSEFITSLRPRHVIHVHGGEDEMKRLQRALAKQYDPKEVEFLTPQNCQAVHLRFPGDKVARVIGSLAEVAPADGATVSSMLVLKENKYTLLAAADLHTATPLASTTVVQRPRFRFERDIKELLAAVGRIFAVEAGGAGERGTAGDGGGAVAAGGEGVVVGSGRGEGQSEPQEEGEGGDEGRGTQQAEGQAELRAVPGSDASPPPTNGQGPPAPVASLWRVHQLVTIEHHASSGVVTLGWEADPLSDTVADAISAILLQLQASELATPTADDAASESAGAGNFAGGTADCTAGDTADQTADHTAGGTAGEAAGGTAGDTAGDIAGEPAASAAAEFRFALRVLADHFGTVERVTGLGGGHSVGEGGGSAEISGQVGGGPGDEQMDGGQAEGGLLASLPVTQHGSASALERWALTVAGHRVVLHGASLPFGRIECESEHAVKRLQDVLGRAQRAFRPVER